MPLKVYFGYDIANVLRGISCSSGLPSDIEDLTPQEAYQRGVTQSLVSVGLGFGLEPVGHIKAGTSQVAGLLWAEAPRE